MSNQYVVRIVFKVNVQQNLNIDKSKSIKNVTTELTNK